MFKKFFLRKIKDYNPRTGAPASREALAGRPTTHTPPPTMGKKLLEKLKKQLEKEKTVIEEELKSFTKRDVRLKGDWDTRFPSFNGGEAGGGLLEKEADEVEEYSTLLPIEYVLELKLKNINSALEKMEGGKYGICEKCGKEIEVERLEISPEAKYCLKCAPK